MFLYAGRLACSSILDIFEKVKHVIANFCEKDISHSKYRTSYNTVYDVACFINLSYRKAVLINNVPYLPQYNTHIFPPPRIPPKFTAYYIR
jgi:hypothetical protein